MSIVFLFSFPASFFLRPMSTFCPFSSDFGEPELCMLSMSYHRHVYPCSLSQHPLSYEVSSFSIFDYCYNLHTCLILISLLVKRQTVNPSPGAVTGGKLVTSSHKRGELRYTVI